jgi:hypothetical protein
VLWGHGRPGKTGTPLTRICSQPSQQAVQGWHSRWAGGLAKVFPDVVAVKQQPYFTRLESRRPREAGVDGHGGGRILYRPPVSGCDVNVIRRQSGLALFPHPRISAFHMLRKQARVEEGSGCSLAD